MNRLIGILCFVALLAATIARGQILIPVAFDATPGASGSQWTTEHYAHNNGADTVWISIISGCQLSAVHACDAPIAPGGTIRLPNNYYDRSFAVWYVTEGTPEALSISSFVRNRANDADRWGTAIPSPRLTEFFDGEFHIAPVPVDPGARVSLRLYLLPWTAAVSSLDLELWLYEGVGGASPKHLVESRTIPLTADSDGEGQLVPMNYAELHDLFAVVAAQNSGTRAYLRVKAPDPHARIWGFASVTNNETQHATVFAP